MQDGGICVALTMHYDSNSQHTNTMMHLCAYIKWLVCDIRKCEIFLLPILSSNVFMLK